MEEQNSKLLNVLISLGVALFAFGCFFYSISMEKFAIDILFFVMVCIQLIIGSSICTLSAVKTQKASHMFIGSILIFWGSFTILIRHVLPFGLTEGWPIYGIMAGVLLFVSGIFKYRKIKFGYGLLATVLFLMSVWFSLFSFDIIKVSFLSVAGTLGPAFLLLIALLLVVFFLLQQRNKKLVVKDEDIGIFVDEDPVLPKNE